MRPYLPVDREEFGFVFPATAAKSLQSHDSVQPHRREPTKLPGPSDSPGKNTGVGCHFCLSNPIQTWPPTDTLKRTLKGSEYSLGLWSWEHDLSARWPRRCQAFWAVGLPGLGLAGGRDLGFGFPWNGGIPRPHQVTWSQPINMRPVRNKGRAEKPADA